MPCGNVVLGRVDCQTEDVVCVCRVESLLVSGAIVDHTQGCNVVDNLSILGVVEVATAVVTSVAAVRARGREGGEGGKGEGGREGER